MAQAAVKEEVRKMFERCYSRLTSDRGRCIALGIYYAMKVAVVIVGAFFGYGFVSDFLP